MKEIELYDIITLGDDSEYMILKMLKETERKYYLIAPVNEQEEPNMQELKIVEEIKNDGKLIIQEETNERHLENLSKQFLELLKEDLKNSEI